MDNKKLWQKLSSQALLGGGEQRLERQKSLGKKTARDRVSLILDEGTFEEVDQLASSHFLQQDFYTDGVVAGFGEINGRNVAIFSQDFTIKGGSLGARHAEKICKVMDMAAKVGCPVIGILDSGGARIDEGLHALAGYGDIFFRNTRLSGVVPQISIILGPCAGGAVYSPGLTDFIFTTDKISQLFITGPQVIEQVTHETITKEELGGANIHASKSGVVHFVAQSEADCFDDVKTLLDYLPDNHKSLPICQESKQAIEVDIQELVADENKGYDTRKIINSIVDEDSFFEVQESFATNIVVGFARIEGESVGLVANQTIAKAGTLDIDASCKGARFINTCNNFNIPIVSLVDVPGFLPGVEQEHSGIIRHGAKLIYAYANATVPKITVILRKAFGGAYIVMGSKHLGADFVFSWPNTQIAVLGAQSAMLILNKDDNFASEYEEEFLNPYTAAKYGYIDAIIDPDQTRAHVSRALKITKNKVEKRSNTSGNIPL